MAHTDPKPLPGEGSSLLALGGVEVGINNSWACSRALRNPDLGGFECG
jgi:hypothetical protein